MFSTSRFLCFNTNIFNLSPFGENRFKNWRITLHPRQKISKCKQELDFSPRYHPCFWSRIYKSFSGDPRLTLFPSHLKVDFLYANQIVHRAVVWILLSSWENYHILYFVRFFHRSLNKRYYKCTSHSIWRHNARITCTQFSHRVC